MIIFAGFIVLIAAGLAIVAYASMDFDFFGSMLVLVGAAGLVLASATLPLTHLEINAELARLNELQATADRMRESGASWEAVAFQSKVADKNQWLRAQQYYNSTVFDLWVPDAVDNTEPVR